MYNSSNVFTGAVRYFSSYKSLLGAPANNRSTSYNGYLFDTSHTMFFLKKYEILETCVLILFIFPPLYINYK